MTALMPDRPVSGLSLEPSDELNFEEFYRDYRRTIATTLAASVGDQELGFEAADEAMSRAFQRWTDVSSYSNPQGWVFRTGRNWAVSVIRRRSMGKLKDQLVARSFIRQESQPDTDLERAVSRLKEEHRSVVELRFYSDLSINQIARELGIPSGTVKSRLSRALVALQQDSQVAA